MSDTPRSERISRRSFLKRGLLLTATVAGAGFLEACAPAAAPAPSAPAPAAPTTAPAAPAAPKAAATTAPAPAAPTAAAKAAPATAPAAAPTAAVAAKSGGTLTIGYGQITSYSHFMHMRSYAGGETIYNRLLAQGKLVQMREPTKEYYGDLAEKWDFAPDGKTLTFTLRKGLKWHDGKPFTAKDVDFTFHMAGLDLGGYILTRYLMPYVMGVQEYIEGKADKITGLKVIDDYTVRFDMIKPSNQDLVLAALNNTCMAPQHILADFLKDRSKAQEILKSEWATTAKHVGIGPFKVVEYVADQYIVFEPYADYHFGKSKLDKLVYRSYKDRQTVAAAIEKKEIDIGWIPETEYARMQKLDFLNFRTPQATLTTATPFNTARPYLKDKRVRQALLHAIDRDAIVAKIYAGASKKIDTLIQLPKYGESPNLKKYNYDPAKAKALLKEAGWDPNTKLRWLVNQIPSDTSIYDAINGFWSEVGVQAEYQVNADLSAGRKPYDFDLYWSSYPIGHPTEFASYTDSRVSEAYYTGFKSARYEELSDKSVQNLSDDEMKKVVFELQEILAEEALFLMICPTPNVWAINKRVHDVLPIYAATGFNDWGGIHKAWVDS